MSKNNPHRGLNCPSFLEFRATEHAKSLKGHKEGAVKLFTATQGTMNLFWNKKSSDSFSLFSSKALVCQRTFFTMRTVRQWNKLP